MMTKYINDIYSKIELLNTLHSKKLKKNMAFFDDTYHQHADAFFEKYIKHLQNEDKSIDYAIECYLQMISDMNFEGLEFARSGKYSSSTFSEVNSRVYARPEIMEYYMHGLIMSQFLWKHHYQMYHYFITSFPKYAKNTQRYLEIGAGHGLYLSRALDELAPDVSVTVVDISQTSIDLSKKFINDPRVDFNVKDIFDFDSSARFDFITMGEVIEHVEDPLQLLRKMGDLLAPGGYAFITTPTNAPAIDHIYLFSSVEEIRELIRSAGFIIESEVAFSSEDVSPEKAEKYKIAILYGAFLKKA